jgi:UDPglucose 6-dehydrogenase
VRVAVLGLWHQGMITAAGLAALGHEVAGIEPSPERLAALLRMAPPVREPGLDALLEQGVSSGRLRFSSTLAAGCAGAEVLWIAHDTPLAENGSQSGAEAVIEEIHRALREAPGGLCIIVSAQLPVGSVRRLERALERERAEPPGRIVYVPENLRIGTAVQDFLHPARLVAGIRRGANRRAVESLLGSIGAPLLFMSVESAEMTKHALNAFLATSVALANEIALLCETAGADAQEVARGLKTDARIGPRAYVSPGAAFAGGTLARDVESLTRLARERGIAAPLLGAVLPSNREHAHWERRKLRALRRNLSELTVAVWGLAYKPGTDTLRGSASVALCEWLLEEGASLRVHDPAVKDLPDRWRGHVSRFDDPGAAAAGADALIVASPLYRSTPLAPRGSPPLVVIDSNRFAPALDGAPGVERYFAVGLPHE